MHDPLEYVKAVPEVAKEIYKDVASQTFQEIGNIGVDAAKTFRLALFPLQYTAAFQDRLAKYIDEAIRKVPEERRISPKQSVALSICERLNYCDVAEEVSCLYVELLARAMDKERVGEAHPAFVNIITQLAPDEILIVRQLGETRTILDCGPFRAFFREPFGARKVLYQQTIEEALDASDLTTEVRNLIATITFDTQELAQPDIFFTFLEHLVSLGIVAYTNDPRNDGPLKNVMHGSKLAQLLFIRLSDFGELFFKACVGNNGHHPLS